MSFLELFLDVQSVKTWIAPDKSARHSATFMTKSETQPAKGKCPFQDAHNHSSKHCATAHLLPPPAERINHSTAVAYLMHGRTNVDSDLPFQKVPQFLSS